MNKLLWALLFLLTSGCSSHDANGPDEKTRNGLPIEAERSSTLDLEAGSASPQLVMGRLADAYETGNVDLFVGAVCPPSIEETELPFYRASLDFMLAMGSLGPLLDELEMQFGRDQLQSALNERIDDAYEFLRGRSRHVDFRRLAEQGEIDRRGDRVSVYYTIRVGDFPEERVSQPVHEVDGRWYLKFGFPMLAPAGEQRRKKLVVDFKRKAEQALATAETADGFAASVRESLAALRVGVSPTEDERKQMRKRREEYEESSAKK